MLSPVAVCPFVSRCGPDDALVTPAPRGAGPAHQCRRPGAAASGTGARLWLRYDVVADATRLRPDPDTLAAVGVASDSPTGQVIAAELRRGLAGLLGREPVFDSTVRANHLLVGTAERMSAVAALGWKAAIDRLGPDGFLIRSASSSGNAVTVIAARTDAGALYGTFHFLRLLQTGAAHRRARCRGAAAPQAPPAEPLGQPRRHDRARLRRRLAVGRWRRAAGHVDPRVTDYARANASLGINGTVINNVNANPRSRSPRRTWPGRGRRRACFVPTASASTSRPTPPRPTARRPDHRRSARSRRRRWWRAKADEIYARIPDFGGFLVKANSEGQPGPQDYGRTHADGANVLADARGAARRHRDVARLRLQRRGRSRPRQARLPGVRAARRPLPRQRARAGQERAARFPAPRALPSAVRRDAEDAADGGTADHPGVPRPLEPPRLPGADVEGVPRRRHLRPRHRLDRGQGRRRHARRRTPTPASPASPTPAATPTGPATTSRRPTGTPSAAWRGTRRSAPAPSPRSGSG